MNESCQLMLKARECLVYDNPDACYEVMPWPLRVWCKPTRASVFQYYVHKCMESEYGMKRKVEDIIARRKAMDAHIEEKYLAPLKATQTPKGAAEGDSDPEGGAAEGDSDPEGGAAEGLR